MAVDDAVEVAKVLPMKVAVELYVVGTGLVIVFKAIDDTVGVAGVKLADLVAVDYPS